MKMRFRFLVAALGGLLCAVAPAAAETVKFTTSFEFASSGTNTISLGAATFKLLGVTNSTVNAPVLSTPFGSIVYNRNGESNSLAGYFDFKFTVTQSAPTGGSAFSLANEFFGAIVLAGGIASVDFVGVPLSIGSITYSPQSSSALFSGSSGSAAIRGDVTSSAASGGVNAAPLPAAVWGGMALCAMVGAWKIRRHGSVEA